MRAAEIEVKALFDLSYSMAGEFLAKSHYSYETLPEFRVWVVAVGSQLSSDGYEKWGEQTWIHKSAKVAPSVSPTGPFIVCVNAEPRHCTYFHENVLIGAGNVAGNSCEFKNSLFFDSVEVSYYNYAGDSIPGYHVRMGAGSTMSNIRPDRKNTVIRTGDEATETGLRKIGAVLDGYVEVGCGTVLDPGSVVGKDTMIYPLTSACGPVSANSIVKNAENIVIKQN